MRKLMLIVNPAAGRGGFKFSFGDAMQVLAAGGMQIDLFFTAGPRDATRFAAENAGNLFSFMPKKVLDRKPIMLYNLLR